MNLKTDYRIMAVKDSGEMLECSTNGRYPCIHRFVKVPGCIFQDDLVLKLIKIVNSMCVCISFPSKCTPNSATVSCFPFGSTITF